MLFRLFLVTIFIVANLSGKTEIWLSGTNFEQSVLPDRILISVFSDKSGLYKIDGFKGVVASGKLDTGHTIIPLKMVLKDGVRRFKFKIRFKDSVEKRWGLVLRVVSGSEEQSRSVQRQSCYVRIYSKGELVADSNKFRIRKLTTKTEGEPEEINYGKYNPVTGDYPGLRRLALPVLALPVMIIKKAVEKKLRNAREKKKRRMRVISGEFRNAKGKDVSIAVMLGVEKKE